MVVDATVVVVVDNVVDASAVNDQNENKQIPCNRETIGLIVTRSPH